MTDLLPNLEALTAQLTSASAGASDARELIAAAAKASTAAELDEALYAVLVRWQSE